MSNHVPQIIEMALGSFQATCNCRTGSKIVKHKWEAEDWIVSHLALVEQAKAHLGPRTISIERACAYYREKSEAEDIPEDQKIEWKKLADELALRIGDSSPDDEEQCRLF